VYLCQIVGRDKVLRTIQYFSRFYAWYLYRTNNPASAIQPWATAKSQLGLTRKIMRVGKFVEHFRAAAEIFDKKDEGGDQVVKYLQVARQLGYAGYLSWDAVTVLDAAGIRSSVGAKDWQRQAYRFWGLGLLASIGAGGWVGWGLWVRGRGVDEKSPDGKVEGRVIERYVMTWVVGGGGICANVRDLVRGRLSIFSCCRICVILRCRRRRWDG
jgi:peroxin-11B